MADKLTDAQVAALPGELLHAATWLETIEDAATYEAGYGAIKRAITAALDLQSHRARRCRTCAHAQGTAARGVISCSAGVRRKEGSLHADTWSCADHTK